jgi:hypothetical protein
MSDAWKTGARDQAASGGARTASRAYRDERWLEHMVRGLYQAVADEPVPVELLDILAQLPDRQTGDALQRARRWRAKAEECQTAAESMATETARNSLLQMARNYLSLARLAERTIDQQSDQVRDIG